MCCIFIGVVWLQGYRYTHLSNHNRVAWTFSRVRVCEVCSCTISWASVCNQVSRASAHTCIASLVIFKPGWFSCRTLYKYASQPRLLLPETFLGLLPDRRPWVLWSWRHVDPEWQDTGRSFWPVHVSQAWVSYDCWLPHCSQWPVWTGCWAGCQEWQRIALQHRIISSSRTAEDPSSPITVASD